MAVDDAPVADITRLIRRWQEGDMGAREQLMEVVYQQVRLIAGRALHAAPGATLTPTELAHESLIRLLGAEASWADRRHLYHVIAQAARQILVSAARSRLRDKRGGGAVAISLAHADHVATQDDAALVAVHEAIEQLGQTQARAAQVIELTYFAGLDRDTIAEVLQISVPSVDRDLRFGRAWLKSALAPET